MVASVYIITALQTIVSRGMNPVGYAMAGTIANINGGVRSCIVPADVP